MLSSSNGSTNDERWLTLSQASGVLGVHPSTLRQWADAGELRSFRTPGGHRRFALRDLHRFLTRQHNLISRRGAVVVQSALTDARQKLNELAEHPESWMSNNDEALRRSKRERGRQLFALAIQYVLKETQRERLLDEGRRLGREYGAEVAQEGMPLVDTARAFQFFRNTLAHALQGGETSASPDAEDIRIQTHLGHFLDEVLFSVLEGYQDSAVRTAKHEGSRC